MDRFSQFALLAAREALDDAGLELSDELSRRTAVILGTGTGGKTTDDEAFRELYGKGNPRVRPSVIPRLMVSAATSHLTIEFGITGPAFTVSSACSSANHAIAQAFLACQTGDGAGGHCGRLGSLLHLRNDEGLGSVARHGPGHLPALQS